MYQYMYSIYTLQKWSPNMHSGIGMGGGEVGGCASAPPKLSALIGY